MIRGEGETTHDEVKFFERRVGGEVNRNHPGDTIWEAVGGDQRVSRSQGVADQNHALGRRHLIGQATNVVAVVEISVARLGGITSAVPSLVDTHAPIVARELVHDRVPDAVIRGDPVEEEHSRVPTP